MTQALTDLFNKYEGKITTTDNSIKIVSNNFLVSKKEECEIAVEENADSQYKYTLSYDEKSCEILGGGGMPCTNEDEVIRNALKVFAKYNFKEKQEPMAYDLWGKPIYD
jgi:hypothetical protein